jgi:hypothetical protein
MGYPEDNFRQCTRLARVVFDDSFSHVAIEVSLRKSMAPVLTAKWTPWEFTQANEYLWSLFTREEQRELISIAAEQWSKHRVATRKEFPPNA